MLGRSLILWATVTLIATEFIRCQSLVNHPAKVKKSSNLIGRYLVFMS